MSAVLPADKSAAAPEIAVYLKESVGNSTRIDYGTGNTMCVSVFIPITVVLFNFTLIIHI